VPWKAALATILLQLVDRRILVAAAKRHAQGAVERERKFLVNRLPPELSRRAHQVIEQGYLDVAVDGHKAMELRIRRSGNRFVLTLKTGRGPARLENEAAISRSAARLLWPLTRGRRLTKHRYKIPHRGLTIEVDVYRGRLRGLRIAEVEFASATALRRFVPPPWFGKEVTGRESFANSRLAVWGWRAVRRHGVRSEARNSER
jgi:adenylate cyclase